MYRQLIFLIIYLCFAFGLHAQQVLTTEGTEVLILPFNPYARSADPAFKEVGEIKLSYGSEDGADFRKQFEKFVEKAKSSGGNIFQVTDIYDHKQNNHFKIEGIAYHADDFAAAKKKALEQKQQKFDKGLFALVTIYRPAYAKGFNDEHLFSIVINDTLTIEMKAETKCILKVAKEGDVRIAVRGESVVQHVSAKYGNEYYVRAFVNYPGSRRTVLIGDAKVPLRGFAPYIEHVADLQGELESSLVNKIIINKKI